MKNKAQLENEIVDLKSLKDLLEVYQEIAAIRMQKVKKSVLKTRVFLEDLNLIYLQTLLSYKNKLLKEKNKQNDAILPYIGVTKYKPVSVFLSSNTALYGGIIISIFNKFIEDIKNNNNDVVIVGKLGKSLYIDNKIERDFAYFDLSDGQAASSDLYDIVTYIKQYQTINIYHGKFKTILNQQVDISNIRDVRNMSTVNNVVKGQENFIYEPSLEEVLLFFENELLGSVLEQTVYESNLSKFAARMVSLDAAVNSINQSLTKTKFLAQRSKHRENNKRQLNTLSGISLWHN